MIADILKGAASGIAATAPMTVTMLWAHRQLPWYERYALPPREVTMKVVDEVGLADQLGENEKTALTTAAHFAYGGAMGSIYGAFCGKEEAGAATGALFGAAVWAGSYMGFLPALGILSPATRHPPRRNLLMFGSHLVWGSMLGGLFQAISAESEKGVAAT